MKNYTSLLLGILVALFLLATSSLYIVDQRQQAILFQLGEVVDVKTAPGLYFKIPLAQNVRYFDSRILTMDTAEPERFTTSEKKNVLVDLFVKWRIIDVKQYYVSVRGDEMLAQTRLAQTVNSSLRDEFGNRTVHDVVSGERDKIMEIMRQKADADARKIGVEVVDVRLKRVDLPQEVSESVYRRMEAERKRVANELRSTGSAESEKIRADADARKIGVEVVDVRLKRVDLPQEVSESVYRRMEAERKRVANELRSTGSAESEKIRADADRQREVILAEAYRNAQEVKGEGDAKASAIYASAFQPNPEFYAFYRSLEAYKQSFKNKSDMMVLEPNSEFFKYLKNSGRNAK